MLMFIQYIYIYVYIYICTLDHLILFVYIKNCKYVDMYIYIYNIHYIIYIDNTNIDEMSNLGFACVMGTIWLYDIWVWGYRRRVKNPASDKKLFLKRFKNQWKTNR